MTAACAIFFLNLRQKICSMNRMQKAKTPGGDHGLTTAATAVTDEIYFLTGIGTELNELLIISDVEQIQTFLRTNQPGMTVLK
jgi:hypothetical protein